MRLLSKLCDAADWCDPVFDRIIRDELAEEPYFHRKQWEFAQIFRALQAHGFLNGRSRGLSMGGGDERLLYAVARRVEHLTVTDLYQAGSPWDGARTEDPDRSLKAAAPFAVDPSRFTARRMDMRALEFGHSSLDFCYSSCAIEHIGEYADFLEHLREVRRVLKDDGVYVLTTEFHYGDQVIPAPHNYYFSADFLDGLMKTAGFAAREGVDGTVSPHPFNRPLPANLGELTAHPAEAVTDMLLKSTPHVQLLTGGLPFTSMSLVLTKAAPGGGGVMPIFNLEPSRVAIAEGVRRWKAFVEHAGLTLDPRASDDCRATGGVSRVVVAGGAALFHTGYVWLGNGLRPVTVDLDLWPADGVDAAVEVRVHRHPDLRPDDVTCDGSTSLAIRARARVRARLQIATDARFSYAVLGRVTSGGCRIEDAKVHVGATDSTDLL